MPLGGLVNHRVHLFWSWCFTLKFSLSWKTVTTLPSASFAPSPAPSPDGEMGMVDRSTCWSMSGAAAGAADAMMEYLSWRCDENEA